MPVDLNPLKTALVFLLFSITLTLNASRPNPNPPVEDADAMCFREALAGWGENYLGIRYRHAGRSPETGFDCSGFTHFVFKEFGLTLSPSSATQSKQGVHIPLNEVAPGDLLFFGSSTRIQHVALIVKRTEEGIFCVHATCSRGIMVENVSTSSYWAPRILYARDVISSVDNIPPVKTVYAAETNQRHKPTTFYCDDHSLAACISVIGRNYDLQRLLHLPQEQPTGIFE
ncbi:MAG: C40 family peptidase [Saprospiraceae bacterium]|jgi:hypothetical protein